MATPLPPQIVRTPDEHLMTLIETAALFEEMAIHGLPSLRGQYAERAAALRWILDQNAYGVEAHEVTT